MEKQHELKCKKCKLKFEDQEWSFAKPDDVLGWGVFTATCPNCGKKQKQSMFIGKADKRKVATK